MPTIKDYANVAYANSHNKGFWDDYERLLDVLNDAGGIALAEKVTIDIKLSKIALMMSELGEAVEGIRKPKPDEHCPEFTSEAVELADCMIRIFDYCQAFCIPLEEAIDAKMAYNLSRPRLHGKLA